MPLCVNLIPYTRNMGSGLTHRGTDLGSRRTALAADVGTDSLLGADTERILGEPGFPTSEIQRVIEAADQVREEMMVDKWEVD